MKTSNLCEFFGVKEGQVFKIEESVYFYTISRNKLLFNYYNDGMWYPSKDCISNVTGKEIKIIKLPPKLTNAERVILENIDRKYNFIARDEDGDLYAYSKIPEKSICDWGRIGCLYIRLEFPNLFSFITWEDDEPYNIRELLAQ